MSNETWFKSATDLKKLMLSVDFSEQEIKEILSNGYGDFKYLLGEIDTLDLLVKILDMLKIDPTEKLICLLENRENSVAINMRGLRLWYNDISGHFHSF